LEKLVRVDIATVRLRSVARKTYTHTHTCAYLSIICVLWLYGIWINLSRERFPRLIRIYIYTASLHINTIYTYVYIRPRLHSQIYSKRRFTCRINIHHDRGKYNTYIVNVGVIPYTYTFIRQGEVCA